MKTACPNCGGEVEFRYDDSFVRVCTYCHAAVARTDRGIETLGKVADLVPTSSPLRLFGEGTFGSTSFMLVGMAQIRHAAGGMWQEWYAKLDGGRWGWLAEAQGRFYLTFEEPTAGIPAQQAFEPGQKVELPVSGQLRWFTVSEVGTASYLGARGELPFRLVPEGTFRFVDLDDGAGTFATIDYGEAGDAASLYIGHQVALPELAFHGGEVAPEGAATIGSRRLACPNCNGSIELRAPDQAQRVVCPYCNNLIACDTGDLQLLGKLADKAVPAIPLGSVGKLPEGEQTVIGYVQRSALVDGEWWPFHEYLLYSPELGFRWLVDSDGHWSYVQPVASGAVTVEFNRAVYEKVAFKGFQNAELRVDQVLGEFYWRVTVGEQVQSTDYVAPPAMLSREATSEEDQWSLATYVTRKQVEQAFAGTQLELASPTGVAPNQIDTSARASTVLSFGFIGLLVIGFVAMASAGQHLKYEHSVPVRGNVGLVVTPPPPDPCPEATRLFDVAHSCGKIDATHLEGMKVTAGQGALGPDTCTQVIEQMRGDLVSYGCTIPPAPSPPPAAPASEPAANVFFSDPIELEGGKNIELSFSAPVDNDWVYVAADIVQPDTGDVVGAEVDLEHWSGVDDGESWSEGDRSATAVIGPQPAGKYLLRLESQRGKNDSVDLEVQLHQGVFRAKYWLWALLVMLVPMAIVGLVSHSFEKRRWSNSNVGSAPISMTLVVLVLTTGIGLVAWAIVKAVLASRSNDD